MKKNYIKSIISILATVSIISTIMPTYALAVKGNHTVVNQQQNSYALGPEGLQEAMAQTGSSLLVMDLYALTILKQENIDMKNIESIDNTLKENLLQTHSDARASAEIWVDKIKPAIVKSAQDIVQFDTIFTSYYQTLLKAIVQKDTALLTKGLTKLQGLAGSYQFNIEMLIEELIKYRSECLEKDIQAFKENTNLVVHLISSKNTELNLMIKQFDMYHESINTCNKLIMAGVTTAIISTAAVVGGIVVCITGVGLPLGLALIGGGLFVGVSSGGGLYAAKKSMRDATKQLQNLQEKNKQVDLEILKLNQLKNQLDAYSETLNFAITALQNINNRWHVVQTQYTSLIRDIQQIHPDQIDFIKEDLKSAYKSWNDVKQSVQKILNTDIQLSSVAKFEKNESGL